MSKYGTCWFLSPLYLQEREASADRSLVYHSFRKKFSVKLISASEKVQGNLPQCSYTKENRVKKQFPTEKAFPQDIKQFKERVNLSSGFSDPEEAARTVLEEQRDHQLAEAKSEISKQECENDTLNTCIREFQRQAHSNRLELDSVNCEYQESRREQARLHEELALREKAL